MKSKCKICAVLETSTPDMCTSCFDAINALDTIQRMLYTFKDSRDGAALAKLLEEQALVMRDDVTKKVKRIGYDHGDNGERIPGLMHTPLMSKYTDRYNIVGGLLKFMIDMIGLHKQETDKYLRFLLIDSIKHLKAYQYLDPNGQGKVFKGLQSKYSPEVKVIFIMNGLELSLGEIEMVVGDQDSITGVGATVIANKILLLRI